MFVLEWIDVGWVGGDRARRDRMILPARRGS